MLRNIFLVVVGLYIPTTLFCQLNYVKNDGEIIVVDTTYGIKYTFDTGSKSFFNSTKLETIKRGKVLSKNALGKVIFKDKHHANLKLTGFGNIKLKGEIHKNNSCSDKDVTIGIDILKKHSLQFNTLNNTIKIDCNKENLDTYIKIPLIKDRITGMYYVNIILNNKVKPFRLDTGFDGDILTNKETKVQYNEDFLFDTYAETVNSHYAVTNLKATKIKGLKGKNWQIDSVKILFVQIPEVIDNLVGLGFFENFEEYIFDFPNNAIYLKNYKNIDNAINNNTIKLQVDKRNEIVVGQISHDNVLYKKGLRVGDIVKLKDKTIKEKLIINKCGIDKFIREKQLNHRLNELIDSWRKE